MIVYQTKRSYKDVPREYKHKASLIGHHWIWPMNVPDKKVESGKVKRGSKNTGAGRNG